MNIDDVIKALKAYKAKGATEVLMSDGQPVRFSYVPIAGNATVFACVEQTHRVPMYKQKQSPVIVEHEQLKTLDEGGRECEVCDFDMDLHAWVALDYAGFVVNCSIAQHKYEKKLLKTGQIKRRALVTTNEGMKDYS